MGARIHSYYAEAEALAGLDGKIQLAMLTRIPSSRALVEPDSPQNIARFESALSVLRRGGSPAAPGPRAANDPQRPARALPLGEELLWGVLSSLDDAIVAVYERGGPSLLTWESRTLQKKYEGLVGAGERVASVLGQVVAERLGDEVAQVFDSAETRRAELSCALGDQEVVLNVTLSPVHHEKGKVLGVAAFVQDVTEQRRAEQRIRESEARLRMHNRVFLELLADKAAFLGDVEATLRRVTEAAARTLDVARVSIWLYDEQKSAITCADLFEKESGTHTAGAVLRAADFPTYFASLEEQRTIAASDAHVDPRTSCFSETYLRPLGIGAMLDVPIWVHGQMLGVVCHEHIGGERTWSADEENLAYLMATFVALSRERNAL